jgi:hypothetical protein
MTKTISDQYLQMQIDLHKNPNYGVASLSFAPIVAALIQQVNIKSVSDYGAGKKNLLVGLQKNGISNLEYLPYDPAFPEYGTPKSAELVCCIDVLEHIEPELLENVLEELQSIVTKLGFFSIHMGPAQKVLSDGRNAHLIQKPCSWWLPILSKYFEVIQLQTHQMMGIGVWMVVSPKTN